MNIVQYSSDILFYIFYHCISNDICNLLFVNKEFFYLIKKYIKTYNNYDLFILNKIENSITINYINEFQNYTPFNLCYNDFIKSSLNLNIFGKFIKLINIKPDLYQLNYLDIIFNYTITTKKLFKKNIRDIEKNYNNIYIQKDLFTIKPTSVLINDIKIFKLLLYINEKFIIDNKIRTILYISLITQLVKYFHNRYILEFEDICNKDNNKFIYKKIIKYSNKELTSFNIDFIKSLLNFNKLLCYYDCNLYNIYSIYITNMIINNNDKYNILETILNPFIDKIREILIYNKISADVINYNETSKDIQINTIKIMMNIFNYNKLQNIKIYIVLIIFKYINNIINNNIAVDEIKKNITFLNAINYKCDKLLENIHHREFSEYVLNYSIKTFNDTKDCIKNLLI
jgi:hypothetical protein